MNSRERWCYTSASARHDFENSPWSAGSKFITIETTLPQYGQKWRWKFWKKRKRGHKQKAMLILSALVTGQFRGCRHPAQARLFAENHSHRAGNTREQYAENVPSGVSTLYEHGYPRECARHFERNRAQHPATQPARWRKAISRKTPVKLADTVAESTMKKLSVTASKNWNALHRTCWRALLRRWISCRAASLDLIH